MTTNIYGYAVLYWLYIILQIALVKISQPGVYVCDCMYVLASLVTPPYSLHTPPPPAILPHHCG